MNRQQNIKNNKKPPIILVDDEEEALLGVSLLLRQVGIGPLVTVQDSRELMPLLHRRSASIILLDLNMPNLSGQNLLPQIKAFHSKIPVIIMTAVQDLETAVACMKDGAFDYLVKPLNELQLESTMKKALEVYGLKRQVDRLTRYILTDSLEYPEMFSAMITRSSKMRGIFQYMETISSTGEAILITGETGTGKELAARALHDLSSRDGPFVSVNVAGLDDHMFSDTLFGHRKGAFTGAGENRQGMVAKAARGTLFLDEIGDLNKNSQVKLLRLLQERTFEPLGSDVARNADIHLLAATNQNLRALMEQGEFRSDLYFRLAGHRVHLPPLRERMEDIPLLVEHFLQQAAKAAKKKTPTPPPELFQLLATYPFPGNIRELRAMTIDAVVRHKRGVLSMQPFKEALGHSSLPQDNGRSSDDTWLPCWHDTHRPPTLKEAEEFLFRNALEKSEGNQGIAAAMLGLTRQALNQRLWRNRKKSVTS